MPILILCCHVTSQLLFLFHNFILLHGIRNSMSIYFIIICNMLSSCLLILFRFLSLVVLFLCLFDYGILNSNYFGICYISFCLKFCNPTFLYCISRFIYLSPFVFHVNSIVLYCIRYLMPHYYTRGRPI